MQPDSRNDYPSGNTASLWVGTFTVPDYPTLTRNRRCEVCVVGAGIAGLSTAYALAKAGRKVIVLDDGPVAGGESGRTTAHLTGAMDDRIHEIERVHGERNARLVVESHLAAVNRIEEIVRLERIDCDLERVDGYLFVGGEDRVDVLEREYDAAKRAGFADAELVDR